MGIRSSLDPYGNADSLVENFIGEAYKKVRLVADNLSSVSILALAIGNRDFDQIVKNFQKTLERVDVVLTDSVYYPTLSEAIDRLDVGSYFNSDDQDNKGQHAGVRWIYKVTAVMPFYEAVRAWSTKADAGLANVDNTSDLMKPISEAQQAALNERPTADALADPTATRKIGRQIAVQRPGSVAAPRFIFTPDNTFVMVGDTNGGVQNDIFEAAYSRRKLIGDPSAPAVCRERVELPQNLNADFRGMELQASSELTSGALAKIGGAISPGMKRYEYQGSVEGLRLIQSLVNDHADPMKNVDGLLLDPGASNISFKNLIISGFRDLITTGAKDVYILEFDNARLTQGWRNGLHWTPNENSGERIVFRGGLFAEIKNPQGTGTAIRSEDGSSQHDIYLIGVSLSYNDRMGRIGAGVINLFECHQENSNNLPMWSTHKITGSPPPVVNIQGGVMGRGPLGSTSWTGVEGARATGSGPWFDVQGNSTSIIVDGARVDNFHQDFNNEEIVRVNGGSLQVLDLRLIVDAGYRQQSGATPLGTGVAPGFCYSTNLIFQGLSGAITPGWTGQSGVSADTAVRVAGTDGGHKISTTTGAGSLTAQIVSIDAGEVLTVETCVHLESIVAGAATLRLDFQLADGTAVLVNSFVAHPGLTVISPIGTGSVTGKILSITSQTQGTFAVGQVLGAPVALAPNTYITKILGGGQFEVSESQEVASTTFYGFSKISQRIQAPPGTRQVKIGEWAQAFNGVARWGRTFAWKQ